MMQTPLLPPHQAGAPPIPATGEQQPQSDPHHHASREQGSGKKQRLYLALEDGLLIAQRIAGQWRFTTRLEGAPISCFALDPGDPAHMYCGIAGKGVLYSENEGNSWQPPQGVLSPSVTALAVSALDGIVYAGTEPGALFLSEDGGRIWLECSALQHLAERATWSFPPRPYSHFVRWIETDPSQPGHLFVAITGGGLLQSQDGGLSFQACLGVPLEVSCVRCSLTTPHVYAATSGETRLAYDQAGRPFPYVTTGGCLRSPDGGTSWEPLNEGIEQHYGWRVAVDPGEPTTLLLSTAPGPLQAHLPAFYASRLSRKQGEHPWQPLSDGLPEAEGTSRYVLAADEEEPGVFYAATGRGVYCSQDRGEHWECLFPLSPRFHAKRVIALSVWRKG